MGTGLDKRTKNDKIFKFYKGHAYPYMICIVSGTGTGTSSDLEEVPMLHRLVV